jgi:prephenate dehydratase
MKIAIQGELGSFSHQAALRAVPNASIIPCAISIDAFDRLRKGKVDAIMIPIENTLAGSVVEHYDLLREQPVYIESEALIRIEHHVIGVAGSSLDEVRRIYSHPVALAQCRAFFQRHPDIEPVAFYDTAGAVKNVLELRDTRSAAIASMQAFQMYGGALLANNVEDDVANFTRFLLVRSGEATSFLEGPHKLSLCCQVHHRSGALAVLLTELAAFGGNLTHIQSRPVHGHPWQYYVFLDALMPDSAATELLLGHLPRLSVTHKVLGRFLAAPEFL